MICITCKKEKKGSDKRYRNCTSCAEKIRHKVRLQNGKEQERIEKIRLHAMPQNLGRYIIKGGARAENSPNWKGDNVGCGGVHRWIKKQLGKASKCINCDSAKNVEWSNISYEYRRDITDWEMLCHKCHFKKDGKYGWGKRKEIFDNNGNGNRLLI